jgi:RNA polymerase sigma-70 factor (ECF subfamily)
VSDKLHVPRRRQNELYGEAAATFGAALERFARAYEADAEKRRDLLQEIHLAIWRSLEAFEGRCSLRTWVYRVAHNTATSHVIDQHRRNTPFLSLEDMETVADSETPGSGAEERIASERLLQLIHRLQPIDRQLMLLYLEGLDANEIGDIVGISPGNVRVQIHRIKTILIRRFHKGMSQ